MESVAKSLVVFFFTCFRLLFFIAILSLWVWQLNVLYDSVVLTAVAGGSGLCGLAFVLNEVGSALERAVVNIWSGEWWNSS